MADPIRTPDDEVTAPGHFYPPILPGRIYHAATYRGHSNGAIDMNRRTVGGAWRQDLGDPVLAAAGGRVTRVDRPSGTVEIAHVDGWRSRYVHMQDIIVKVGDRVERGDQIGEVGNKAGGPASSFGPHLHFAVERDGKPEQVHFEGKPVRTSVVNSDTKPEGWVPPDPVEVIGPPARATWQSAYEEAAKRLERSEARVAARNGTIDVLTGERDEARRMASEYATLTNDLRSQLAACEARPPADCTGVEAERDGALAMLARIREVLA